MKLTPLSPGQIRPRGDLADRLRAVWPTGLVEGTPGWVRHALLVGEGRGQLLVKAWARNNGILDLAPAAGLAEREVATAWADDLESHALAGQVGFDEYVCQMVWADAKGLRVALYGSATVKTEVAGTPLELVLDADSVGAKVVSVGVYPDGPASFTLFFRIPSWANGCLVTGEGASGVDVVDHDGWIELGRRWNRGDELTLRFDV